MSVEYHLIKGNVNLPRVNHIKVKESWNEKTV